MSTITPHRPPVHRTMPAPVRPAPGQAAPTAATTIDPIRVLRRHTLTLIASIFIGAVLGVAAFFAFDRWYSIYSAEVIFEIQPGLRESRELGQEIMRDDLAFRLANTETVVLTSRDVLQHAVRHPSIRETQWHRNFLITAEDGREVFDIESAVDDLEKSLSATVLRGTNFFRLSWRAHNDADLPVVLNRIAEVYITRRGEQEARVWNDNIDVFRRELASVDQELSILEAEISNFIVEHGITSLDDARYSQVARYAEALTNQINNYTSLYSMTKTALAQTDAKIVGTLQPTSEDVQEALAHPIIVRANQNVHTIRTELHRLRDRLQPGHPAISDMEGRLRAAEIERDAKLDEIIKQNLDAMAKRLHDQLERYDATLREAQLEADAKDQQLRELAARQADYLAMEKRRERLEMQRVADMEMIKAIQLMRARSDAARVRRAMDAQRPREKSFPKAYIVVPLAALLSLAFTVGFIFLRELTDQRIKSASDLSVLANARVLGVIPELDEDPTKSKAAEMVVQRYPHSVLAESYRQTCALLSRVIERNGHQTLLFLGGLPGAGTTTAITNVACSLAASGRRVLAIDANFRRPRLAEAFGVSGSGPGLGDLLVGAASVEDTILDVHEGVSIIPAGTPANRIFERLNNGNFESVIAELRGQFDIILFDAPPAVVAGDALVLANRVDASILVVRANQEQRGLVARLLTQLADARCESLGVLLNRPRGTAGGYFKANFEAMAKYTRKA